MGLVFQAIAACRDGLAHVAGSSGLELSLFLAGLGGSALHCVGMCGPSVFGLGLLVTGVLFAWWMIKTAYDEAEASS